MCKEQQSSLYTCLVVEDEPLAIEMMVDYITRRNDLVLIDVVSERSELRLSLNKCIPSIIFLDLMIPSGKPDGLRFDELPLATSVVVISAIPLSHYHGKLPQGKIFELPKPLSFQCFERCVNDVLTKRKKNRHAVNNQQF